MNRLKVFINYPNKKSLIRIVREVLILSLNKKEIPFYYFKYLYRNVANAQDYLNHASLREQRLLKTHPRLHKPEYIKILTNKLSLSLFCQEQGLATPKTIAYNHKHSFTLSNNNDLSIKEPSELINLYEKLLTEGPLESVFFRPLTLDGGKGCFKITKANYAELLKKNFDTIMQNNYIHNAVVKQHPNINAIHKNALNTIRFITLITEEGATEIVFVAMRFGTGQSVVDNASSGGFFVKVDIESGELGEVGYFLPQHGGEEITHHPDSHVRLKGFKIPYFKEAKQLVVEAVKRIPNRLIGWDIGISETGPVIIEANTQPHIQGANIALGGILKNPRVKEIVEILKSE